MRRVRFAAVAALGASFFAPSVARAQLSLETRPYSAGAPGSTANAVAAWGGLPTGATGYGSTNALAAFANFSNGITFGGSDSDIAFHGQAALVITATNSGSWTFRLGPDAGWGGTLLVDGTVLQENWNNLWWANSWTDPTQILSGSITLAPGVHDIEWYTFEDCCDGPEEFDALVPGGAGFAVFSPTNFPVGGVLPLSLSDAVLPTTVQAGAQATYTITYTNLNDVAANGIVLTDAVPTNSTFVSATGGGTLSGGTVTWSIAELDPSASSSVAMVVQAASPVANGTMITDAVAGSVSNFLGTSSASATATIASAAVLSLSDGATPNPVQSGGTLTFTLPYANAGTDTATDVVLTDAIPANTTFQSASGGGTASGGLVTWPLGTLVAGQSGTVTMTLTVADPIADGTSISDGATMTSSSAATVTASAMATASSAPGLTLSNAAVPSPVAAGGQVTYTITYGNSGSDVANGVTITDPLPPNATFVSATDGGTYDATTQTVTWSLATLSVGASGAVSLVVTAPSPAANGTAIDDTATIASSNASSVAATANDSISSAPQTGLTNTASLTSAHPGDSITYTIAYTNTGTDAAQSATIADAVPTGTTFASATGGGTLGAGTVTWSLGSVAAGASGSVTMTVTVNGADTNAEVLADTASLAATNASTQTASASTTVVVSAPDAGAGPDAGSTDAGSKDAGKDGSADASSGGSSSGASSGGTGSSSGATGSSGGAGGSSGGASSSGGGSSEDGGGSGSSSGGSVASNDGGSGDDGGNGVSNTGGGGCGCEVAGVDRSSAPGSLLAMGIVALAVSRRRRARRG